MVRHVEQVMGTVFSFDLRDENVDENALADAVGWLRWVDATFSTYRADSDVRRLDRGEVRLAPGAPQGRTLLELCAGARPARGRYLTPAGERPLRPAGFVEGRAGAGGRP